MQGGDREQGSTSVYDWLIEKALALKWIVYPLLRLTLTVVGVFSISVLVSIYLYFAYRPVSLIREPVYFDFSKDYPETRVTLGSAEKQWSYLKHMNPNEDEVIPSMQNFLRTGSRYTFLLEFHLSKSDRNRNLAKFMVHVTSFDATAEAVSVSSRPVVLPWEHPTVTLLSSLCRWPLHILGVESNVVKTVEVMNDYREPSPPTDFVELRLSNNDFDVEQAFLSIIPETAGISYLVYHYPLSSIFMLVWVVSALLFAGLAVAHIVGYLSSEPAAADDSGRTTSGAGASAGTGTGTGTGLGRGFRGGDSDADAASYQFPGQGQGRGQGQGQAGGSAVDYSSDEGLGQSSEADTDTPVHMFTHRGARFGRSGGDDDDDNDDADSVLLSRSHTPNTPSVDGSMSPDASSPLYAQAQTQFRSLPEETMVSGSGSGTGAGLSGEIRRRTNATVQNTENEAK
jgi:hypothetical protein